MDGPTLILNVDDRNSLIFLFLTIIASMLFIRFIYSNARKTPVMYSFIFIHILIIIWSWGLILEELAIHSELWLRWGSLYVSYIGICFFSFGWLIFCGFFSKSKFVLKRKNLIILGIPCLIFYMFLLTNKYHNLFYIVPQYGRRQMGPVFMCLLALSYVYLISGFALLFIHAFKSKGDVKRQTLLIISISVALFILNIFRLAYNFPIETTPVTVSISTSIIFTYAALKYRLFSIVPMSVITFLESVDQGILIVDSASDIVRYNKTLVGMFDNSVLICENESAIPFFEYFKSICSGEQNDNILKALENIEESLVQGQLELNVYGKRYYEVKIQPVKNRRGKIVGKIISFNDITEIRLLNDELAEKNFELNAMNDDLNEANEKLLEHVLSIEELSIAKERNRILNEMHDSIGQTYTVILSLISLCRSESESNLETVSILNQMTQITKSGLGEIRDSIYNQRNHEIESSSLEETLEKLIKFYDKSTVKIELITQGDKKPINYKVRHAIYRVLQESLTNSIKHGNANEVYVIIEYKNEGIRMFILDNGEGCVDIVKGIGLKGIEQRIYDLEGKISYGSQEDSTGFYIQFELPIS